jgi:hypothetical protein
MSKKVLVVDDENNLVMWKDQKLKPDDSEFQGIWERSEDHGLFYL